MALCAIWCHFCYFSDFILKTGRYMKRQLIQMNVLMPLWWLASLKTCSQKDGYLREAWGWHLKPGHLSTLKMHKFYFKTERKQGLGPKLVLVSKEGLLPSSRQSGRRPSHHCWGCASLCQSGFQRIRLDLFTLGRTLCFSWSTNPETSRIMSGCHKMWQNVLVQRVDKQRH